MSEAETDALFARVLATPDGRRLLNVIASRRRQVVTLLEIDVRIARARASWEIRAPVVGPRSNRGRRGRRTLR